MNDHDATDGGESGATGAEGDAAEAGAADADPAGSGSDLEARTDDGRTVYVTREEAEKGSDGPFFVAYVSPDRERRYGWLCGNCDTFDNAMDSMGRIECNRCPNFRKPTDWDAAHE